MIEKFKKDEPCRQTPEGKQIFLDHVGWFVPDMEKASEAFNLLGFPLTPFTVHMNEQANGVSLPSGTANRCAMIKQGYLEVLTKVPVVESAITRQMDVGLSRYTGIHLIALTVADTEATTERLREAGFMPEPPIALRRPMPLDDGGEGTAAFSVIRLPSDAMAEGRVQVLSQDTPDVVWQPSMIAEENALDMLSGVLIYTSDPKEAAIRYERFTGKGRGSVGTGYDFALDRGRISLRLASEAERILPGIQIPDLPFVAAVSIRSSDLAATRSYLAAREIPLMVDEPGRIIIHPDAGMGASLVIHSNCTDPFLES
jgi:hypothetical protein